MYYQCDNCNAIFEWESNIPEECPKCCKKCTFRDVTNYTDEKGGPGNIDTNLIKK